MLRIYRNLIGVTLWLSADCALGLLNFFALWANYLSCEAAFELLGWEAKPLDLEPILGIVSTLFPGATLCHIYAMVLAIGEAVGFWMFISRINRAVSLIDDRRFYLAKGDTSSVSVINKLLIKELVLVGTIASMLSVVVLWDVALFRFRALANTFSIESPDLARAKILQFDRMLGTFGHLFAVHLAQIGAFGYVALTGLFVLSMDLCVEQTKSSFNKWASSLEDLLKKKVQATDDPSYLEEV